jgi:hypothetical protein
VTSWLDREIRRAKRKPVVRPGAKVYVMSKAPKGRSLKSGCPLAGVQPATTSPSGSSASATSSEGRLLGKKFKLDDCKKIRLRLAGDAIA